MIWCGAVMMVWAWLNGSLDDVFVCGFMVGREIGGFGLGMVVSEQDGKLNRY